MLLFIVSIIFVVFFIFNQLREKPDVLPSEFSDRFDPHQTTPIFRILGASDDYTTVEVVSVFPEDFLLNIKTSSRVLCDEQDYLIYASPGEHPVSADKTFFFDTISESDKKPLLSAICGDPNCARLVRECKLYLY